MEVNETSISAPLQRRQVSMDGEKDGRRRSTSKDFLIDEKAAYGRRSKGFHARAAEREVLKANLQAETAFQEAVELPTVTTADVAADITAASVTVAPVAEVAAPAAAAEA